MSARWLLGVVLAFCAFPLRSEFDTAAYRPATLTETQADECDSEVAHTFDSRLLKIQAVVTSQGEVRKIEADVLDFIRYWGKVYLQQQVSAAYSMEARVQEEGHDYWLPIQDQLVEAWGTDVERGHSFKVYVVYAGCAKEKPVFLVTAFLTDDEEEEPPADPGSVPSAF